MELLCLCTTEKGRYHKNNEDSYFIGNNLVIIADGMGGENDGDIASQIAVDTISKILVDIPIAQTDAFYQQLLFDSITKADENIFKYITEHPESDGMGTTVLILIYQNGRFYIAWCGDSRCYSYHAGKVASMTKDHSYVQYLIDLGEISIEESFSHPDNNLITRFVGGGSERCKPEFLSFELQNDDLLIMCSDGLSGYCRDSVIEKTISHIHNLSSLPNKLKELAIKHGSDDDITIISLKIDENNTSFWRKLFKGKSRYKLT
ncbi:MAG: PP2C family protein-serine/threonine phosphatase [Lepagella sp.]